MNFIGSIGVYSTGQRFAWRGMSSADYSVSSSLQRIAGPTEDDVRRAELEILREAREWGLGVHATGRVDDLQLLSDLQHFGVPTRLIDVTSNPMTALWFACQPSVEGTAKSGLLLALNVTNWDRLSTVTSVATWGTVSDPQSARLKQTLLQGTPFILESAAPNARLRAQEGFFVAGAVPPVQDKALGSGITLISPTPFDSIRVTWKRIDQEQLERRLAEPRGAGAPAALPFVAILINAQLKVKLRKYLEGTYNRSARVLFPDYEGYRQYGENFRG
ncbi:FRG domain-containing protein [Labedella gwakjiensis]|nr:FRG domain-containing protein [Labedella gwakjiensis]